MIRRLLACIAGSAAILTPCFWHARIQAGDLASHLYNAWLAQLIEAGRAPGLAIVPQNTNALFDVVLQHLLAAFGPDVAQRLAVSLAVLIFAWGAFVFVCRVSDSRPWHLLPIVVMLAYGWVFRMGLFNFYISLGLCWWALALAWNFRPRALLASIPLLALACLAHTLPVAWAAAILVYRWIAGRISPRLRVYLLGAAIAAIAIARVALQSAWKTLWLPQQFTAMAAIGQVHTYGGKYMLPAAGLLFCWAIPAVAWMRDKGSASALNSIPFHICALTSAGILILPDWIRIPGYQHALVFLAERMSLTLGICVCGMLGAVPVRAPVRALIAVVVVVFFAFSYTDERALNSLEDQMTALVATLPPGQRVVSAVVDLDVATNPTTHLIDRACLERCYSYGNYEPSSAQFRIRLAGQSSPLVVASDNDANALQTGDYIVQSRDLPLYQVLLDTQGNLTLRTLSAGQKTGITPWAGL